MSDFNDFLNLISEGKKVEKEREQEKKIFSENLHKNDFFNFLMHADPLKESVIEETIQEEIVEEESVINENNQILSEKLQDNDFFNFLMQTEPLGEEFSETLHENLEELYVVDQEPEIELILDQEPVTEPIVEKKSQDLLDPSTYDKFFKTNVNLFDQPNLPKVSPELKAITDKVQYMENWLTKISMAGPGGGEVNLRYLDDIDRSSIYDGRYLRYNDIKAKFEFAEVNPHDIVYTTNLITAATYQINDSDYYVGINYAGPVSITLPPTPSSGRMLIIKDESGNASTNPITVSSPTDSVDNDPGGFTIQLDNGGVQLLYRNGWRIV